MGPSFLHIDKHGGIPRIVRIFAHAHALNRIILEQILPMRFFCARAALQLDSR